MTTATNYKQNILFDENTIETTVARRAHQVVQWLADNVIELGTGKPIIIGLDIEWNRTSNGSDGQSSSRKTNNNKAAILQLCIKNKCLIIHLMYMDFFPQNLNNLFSNNDVKVVGLDMKAHAEKLREYGLHCATTIDIKELANQKWPGHFTGEIKLKDIAYKVAKMKMQELKHITMSDWEARYFSVEQIEYATIDAYASLRIGQVLLNMK